MAQVLGSLSTPMWETQMEFGASVFDLDQFWLLRTLGEKTSSWKISLCPETCLYPAKKEESEKC